VHAWKLGGLPGPGPVQFAIETRPCCSCCRSEACGAFSDAHTPRTVATVPGITKVLTEFHDTIARWQRERSGQLWYHGADARIDFNPPEFSITHLGRIVQG